MSVFVGYEFQGHTFDFLCVGVDIHPHPVIRRRCTFLFPVRVDKPHSAISMCYVPPLPRHPVSFKLYAPSVLACLNATQAHLFYTALMLPDVLYSSNAYFAALSAHQRNINKLAILDKHCIRVITIGYFQHTHTAPIYLARCPFLNELLASCDSWCIG